MFALVEALRTQFKDKYADNINKGVYDQRDVARLLTSSKYAEAFVRHQKGITKNAADMCHKALKWRKEFGLNDLTDASFPEELLTKGAMFFRNEDKEENPIMYFRIKEHKKNAATLPIITKYMVYLLDREDKRQEGRQVVILFDMSGAGISNLDLDLIKFLITSFEEYFPDYLAYLLVFDMPWILNTAWKIIKAWLSEEARQKVIFVRGQEILQHINKENLFVHMGGSDNYTYKYEAPPPSQPALMNGHHESSTDETESSLQNHVAASEPVNATPAATATATATSHTPEDRKHVTFSNEDPTVFTSIIHESDVDSEASATSQATPTKPVSTNTITVPNNIQIKSPPTRKISTSQQPSKDESVHISKLITICPGSEMVFTSNVTPAVYQCTVVLSNPRTDLRTAYKVKTTTPERYKVKPSLGLIKPGQSTEILVYVIGSREEVNRDKFMVMAMEVEDGFLSTGELAELWKTVNKSKIIEHRLKCSLVLPAVVPDVKITDNASLKLTDLEKHLTDMNDKLSTVLASNQALNAQVTRLNRLVKITLLLLLCFILVVIFTTYHRLGAIGHYTSNRSSALSCLQP